MGELLKRENATGFYVDGNIGGYVIKAYELTLLRTAVRLERCAESCGLSDKTTLRLTGLDNYLMGMVQEFKEVALKGSLVDMAVGIVMGGAIGTLVGSLIDNLIDPLVGLATGGVSLGGLKSQIGERTVEVDGVSTIEPLYLNYGAFMNAFMQFLILAFVIFMIIKAVNSAKRTMAMEDEAAGPSEVDLLTEIRDSLKK